MFETPDDLYKLGWNEVRLEAFLDVKWELCGPQLNITTTSNESVIRICCLNVYGVKSKWLNGVFEDYRIKFDILCFSETKIKTFTLMDSNVSHLSMMSRSIPILGYMVLIVLCLITL